jgi:hypothetical protein
MRVLFPDYGLAPLRGTALLARKLGSWFGIGYIRLLFRLRGRPLGTVATEVAGKLASVIRVNLGVVLGS